MNIKQDFPLLQNQNIAYLDSGATTQKPIQVIKAVEEFYEKNNANPHRGAYTLSIEATEEYENTRTKIAELRGTKTNIDIDVQGALKDEAKKNFKGTIDFKKGSKKAKGNENEYCMLLSDKAKSIALPMLLCTEEDVEGNHSTASGKVDEKQLFYIMTRGISYKKAVKLIVKSKFNKIIERITDEELKNEILSEIDKRLD